MLITRLIGRLSYALALVGVKLNFAAEHSRAALVSHEIYARTLANRGNRGIGTKGKRGKGKGEEGSPLGSFLVTPWL
jgi:hypothetical protein